MQNRIIKFRAWDGFKMYEPCVWMGKEYIPILDSFVETRLMQFTGLLDKNGVEIYEGDIVRYFLPDMQPSDNHTEYVEEVTFEDGCFCVDGFTPVDVTIEWGCEIIGNIYENPELLTPTP